MRGRSSARWPRPRPDPLACRARAIVYAAIVARVAYGAGVLVVLSAASPGCFQGSFLDDTCERLPDGCAGTSTGTPTTGLPTTGDDTSTSTSTGDDTSTGVTPTTAATATTDGPPGVLLPGPAFRIKTLQIVDPHLYLQAFMCGDVHGFINAGLTTSIEEADTNLVLLARNYDPDAATQEFLFYRDAECPIGEDYCLLIDSVLPTTFISANKDEGNCLDINLSTVNPDHVLELTLPNEPCVVSPTASLPLELSPELDPINFYLGRFAAQYVPDTAAPTSLDNAVLHGFIPRDDALKINYSFMGTPINLWSVIRGGDHPMACPVPMDGLPGSVSDVDMVDLDGPGPMPPIAGVFLYLNFTAKKIDFYAPA